MNRLIQKALVTLNKDERLKDNAKINNIEELPITYSNEKDSLLSKESTIVFDKKVRLGSQSIFQMD